MNFFTILFIVSGLLIAGLIFAKMVELKRKKQFFLLRLVSLGDHRVREWSHQAAHSYDELKERAMFFIEKQLPLHSKNTLNKTKGFLKEKTDKYMGDIRNTKLLKRNEGISEFFKNISDKENGVGENEDGSQNESDEVK